MTFVAYACAGGMTLTLEPRQVLECCRRQCADCGKQVTPRRTRPGWKDKDNLLICRGRISDGKLIWADYHYVEGEEQRHWKVPS